MRPVDRGACPTDAGGVTKVFSDYADARADLFDRIGRYCSFCERPIKAGLAVEHVLPKSLYPKLEREWTNFLLACINCNSTKLNKPVNRKRHYLPDQDNTFRAFQYGVGGIVRPHSALKPAEKGKATRTIELVGLDKKPLNDPQARDLRWNDRREAWDKATRYFTKLQQPGVVGPSVIEDLVELYKADGHWSIWMTVFEPRPDVCRMLIDAYPGTCPACFDSAVRPRARPGGQI